MGYIKKKLYKDRAKVHIKEWKRNGIHRDTKQTDI